MTWSTLNDPEEHYYFSKFILHLWGDLSGQSLLLFLFAGNKSLGIVVPNWVVPALLCFGSQWIRGMLDCRAWDYCVPWRNICTLLMHVYILQSELLAFLAVDIHVSCWGYDTWKTLNKKATLMLWNLLICSISFGILACKFGDVGH